jgi:hypothetical protein
LRPLCCISTRLRINSTTRRSIALAVDSVETESSSRNAAAPKLCPSLSGDLVAANIRKAAARSRFSLPGEKSAFGASLDSLSVCSVVEVLVLNKLSLWLFFGITFRRNENVVDFLCKATSSSSIPLLPRSSLETSMCWRRSIDYHWKGRAKQMNRSWSSMGATHSSTICGVTSSTVAGFHPVRRMILIDQHCSYPLKKVGIRSRHKRSGHAIFHISLTTVQQL